MKKVFKTSINDFQPSETDTVIMDTNILLDLFYPIIFETNNDNIDTLFSRLKAAKSNLIISSIQISEFINRCIRIQFNLYKQNIDNSALDFKKDYRGTDDYREKMNGILDIIKSDIASSFKFIDDGFSRISYDRIFIYGFSYDFNDALIVEIAKQQDAIIVTNDRDYANYGNDFPLVTNNKFLLMLH